MTIAGNLSIAIAGAGLMGRLLAWRLSLAGHRITLCESGSFYQPVSAAHTAAAMISPLSEVVVSERAIYDMGMASLKLWPSWLEALNTQIQPAVNYGAKGSLVVAHPQDEAELAQFYQDLSAQLGSDNTARWLNRRELTQLEPDLAPAFTRGLFLPDEGHLDNRQLLTNLLVSLQRSGVYCLEHTPVEFYPEPFCASLNMQGYDWVIDCRGMGGKASNQNLRGVRGEVLWVETPEVHFSRPIRLMHPRYKLYIVPKPGQRFIIGATEIESEDRSPMSLQSLLELGSALYTLNPAFAEARILELDANLRPSFWDNLPQIHQYRPDQGPAVLTINGLYRHGFLLAPYLVEEAIKQLHSGQIHSPTQHAYT